MHDQPSVPELVQAVKNFIDHSAAPELTGRAAFHARVASNVLSIILRDLETRPGNDAAEKASLIDLLDADEDTPLGDLNEELQRRIRQGEIGVDSSDLMTHLKMTAIRQLKVDQPGYSGLAQALKE